MKKGFTLIEMLSVIVILAVLALIVVPVMTNIIAKVRLSADKRSAEAYIKAGENYFTESTLLNSDFGVNIIDKLNLSSHPGTGEVIVYENGTVSMTLILHNLCYVKSANESIADLHVYDDLERCGNVNDIYNITLKAFPELEVGDNGCKSPNNSNYTYMGGCYLRGDQTSNYLWYSGFVWQIMGINKDKTIRLVNTENVTATTYNYDDSTFSGSYIDNWLNSYFYNYLENKDIITATDFCSGEETASVTNRTTCKGGTITNTNIGLLSLDEIAMANGSSSYLKNGEYFWTMSPYDQTNLWHATDNASLSGNLNMGGDGVRPVLSIKPTTMVKGGTGILSNNWDNDAPYLITGDTSKTGYLKENAVAGEYVLYANHKYRVVNIDKYGNTKLLLDDYYKENGSIVNITFGSNNTFNLSNGIGSYLNTTVLNNLIDTTNQSKLSTYDWYQSKYTWGSKYTASLDESGSSIQAKVGLVRVGEMLSGQSNSMLTAYGTLNSSQNNVTSYWTLTPYEVSTDAWRISDTAFAGKYVVNSTGAIRPSVVVNSAVTISKGKGTPYSPYEI